MIHFYCAKTKGVKKNFGWLFSSAIKFFTHFEYPEFKRDEVFTHVSIGEDLTVSGKRLIFQSNITQELNVYDNPSYTAYLIFNGGIIKDRDIFWDIVNSQVSKPYAFLQIIDFIRVWAYNKALKRDPKNVWFPQNRVCSEQGYHSAKKEADKYGLERLSNLLIRYKSDFYSPMRLYRILKEAEKHKEVYIEKNMI